MSACPVCSEAARYAGKSDECRRADEVMAAFEALPDTLEKAAMRDMVEDLVSMVKHADEDALRGWLASDMTIDDDD
jgi:hypothetical protein